jgi:hypothetical protein
VNAKIPSGHSLFFSAVEIVNLRPPGPAFEYVPN